MGYFIMHMKGKIKVDILNYFYFFEKSIEISIKYHS